MGLGSELGVQAQEAADGGADDAAGVIDFEDHRDGADDRLLAHSESLRRRGVLRGFEQVHDRVLVPSMRVPCASAPRVGARSDQR